MLPAALWSHWHRCLRASAYPKSSIVPLPPLPTLPRSRTWLCKLLASNKAPKYLATSQLPVPQPAPKSSTAPPPTAFNLTVKTQTTPQALDFQRRTEASGNVTTVSPPSRLEVFGNNTTISSSSPKTFSDVASAVSKPKPSSTSLPPQLAGLKHSMTFLAPSPTTEQSTTLL